MGVQKRAASVPDVSRLLQAQLHYLWRQHCSTNKRWDPPIVILLTYRFCIASGGEERSVKIDETCQPYIPCTTNATITRWDIGENEFSVLSVRVIDYFI
ncbi:hypothetical protein X801_10438, partial [Opisthorchis viverrini]